VAARGTRAHVPTPGPPTHTLALARARATTTHACTHARTLARAGITRERLEGFDRAITLEPQWFDGKKDSLIRDFRGYLGILKAVHSGADMQASAAAAGNK
jgi:hypothetical protein